VHIGLLYHIYLFSLLFRLQVSAGGQSAQGSGPNKKLAKRSAAEALLQTMGYSRPTLQPGKPALKSSSSTASTASCSSSISQSSSANQPTTISNGSDFTTGKNEKTKKVSL
jgi:hypothetical protein